MNSTEVKGKAKGFFKKLIAIVVLVLIGVILFLYYVNISDGSRAGVIVKISKRGMVFKTYEGQMDIGSFGALKDANQLSQTFQFSVLKDDEHVYETLEQVSLTGERVQIKYKEKYSVLFWRGETNYFVYEVIRSANPSVPDSNDNNFPNPN